MSVHILLITHENIGAALLDAAKNTYGKLPLPAEAISITYQTDPEEICRQLAKHCHDLDNEAGILVLTDLFGSTPSNIATSLCQQQKMRIIAGLNLPMLIRLMNYPHLSLDELAEKALSGGHDGVLDVA